MKRLLFSLLSAALVALAAAGPPLGALQRMVPCGRETNHCCGRGAKTHGIPDSVPRDADCLKCCALGCAVVLTPAAEVALPAGRVLRWRSVAEHGYQRTDEPLLPPPRSGRLQSVS